MVTLLRDLEINKSYTSKENDIVKEFINPTLSISSLYYRVSAYYSSYSLRGIAEGLSSMIMNNAKIKMIISFFVSEQDYNAFMEAKEKAQVYIEEHFINNKEELKRFMIKDSVKAFSFLVATGRLKIKFVVSTQGIFHEKYGIIFDSNNDYVGFSGSMNETLDGLTVNFEKIKVFKSWKDEEREYIYPDLQEFERYWEGNIKDCIIQDIPDKNRNVILESYEEITREMDALKSHNKGNSPWPQQIEALQAWKENGYKGILEMATGTGKTRAAILGITDFLKFHSKSLILIAVPTDVLVSQWDKELRKKEYGITTYIKKVSGDSAVSIDYLYQIISTREISSNDGLIILGTYKMLSSEKFSKLISSSSDDNILLVADEVHHIAAENYSKVMEERYYYRLGLSATPERYFDEEGSQAILNYFGGVVYKFDLKDAISKDILTPYEYYMHFTYLNERETSEYEKLTKKIFNSLNHRDDGSVNEDKSISKKLENLIIMKRARILKKASGKKQMLKSILVEMKRKNQLNHLLVYFEDNDQIANYQDVFDELFIFSVKLDSEKSEQERDTIIEKFSRGDIDCLLAMKILDEGVDVPSVERAIIVSSSGNPAQFVQRRGRLLRRFVGKTKAEIHDILISVDNPYGLNELNAVEKSILNKELKRAILFCETAMNSIECMDVILNVSLKYNLGVISS